MDDAAQLAALTAGDLDDEAADRLRARLARDPELRRRLAAQQALDEALARWRVEPMPPEAVARLTDRIETALAETPPTGSSSAPTSSSSAPTGSSSAPTGSSSAPADLATHRARRRRTGPPPWLLGAAAAAAVVAVGVAVLPDLTTGADDQVAEGPEVESLDQGEGTAEVSEPESEMESAAEPGGPLVVPSGRVLDEAALETLLGDPEVRRPDLEGLDDDAATSRASANRAAVLDATITGNAEAEAAASEEDSAAATGQAGGGEAQQEDETVIGPSAPLRTTAPISDEDRLDVARCLDALLTDSPPEAVFTYAELGTLDGEEVVALGLLTPTTEGGLGRTEVWVLGRDDCQVRRFVQRG